MKIFNIYMDSLLSESILLERSVYVVFTFFFLLRSSLAFSLQTVWLSWATVFWRSATVRAQEFMSGVGVMKVELNGVISDGRLVSSIFPARGISTFKVSANSSHFFLGEGSPSGWVSCQKILIPKVIFRNLSSFTDLISSLRPTHFSTHFSSNSQ